MNFYLSRCRGGHNKCRNSRGFVYNADNVASDAASATEIVMLVSYAAQVQQFRDKQQRNRHYTTVNDSIYSVSEYTETCSTLWPGLE